MLERTEELLRKNKLLEEQTKALYETNTLLEEKQHHIKRQSEELFIQRNDLYELNDLKDKLFSIIAHDLQGPFSSLVGLTKLIVARYNQYTDDKKLHKFKVINESFHSIYILLENLLGWSRAQRGVIDLRPRAINLVELIQTNIKLLENSIINKEITLYMAFEKNPYRICLDSDLINTVIRNLLNNAIKYTNKQGCIEIGFSSETNTTKIWIKDNGIGISEDNLSKLFNKRNSFSTPGTNNEKGTGLGLLLCKEFVEKHKGKLWVESQVGQGSTFYFTIPCEN